MIPPPSEPDDDPFITLFDIAGIVMLVGFFCVPLVLLGSRLFGFSDLVVLTVLFYGAYFFAERGSK